MHLEIIQPDDWHCHLRDGAYLTTTVLETTKHFKRFVVMPNLSPPVSDVPLAEQYLQRIKAHLPSNHFTPLMVIYLTDKTTPQLIHQAKASGIIFGFKLYPLGVTTHSQAGITNFSALYPVFAAMSEQQFPLLVHGEVNSPSVDIFDREQCFIEQHLSPLIKNFPNLKIVLEHISTQYAVDFIKEAPANVGATITPHHLLLNRNHLLAGELKPHYYCLPILKKRSDQEALIKAAISGNPKFFIGTDSAPHPQIHKESACGCAGIYNTPTALAIYAQVFEENNALDKLSNFTSRFGPEFYGLPIHSEKYCLQKKPWCVPESIAFGQHQLIPFLAGQTLNWQKGSL